MQLNSLPKGKCDPQRTNTLRKQLLAQRSPASSTFLRAARSSVGSKDVMLAGEADVCNSPPLAAAAGPGPGSAAQQRAQQLASAVSKSRTGLVSRRAQIAGGLAVLSLSVAPCKDAIAATAAAAGSTDAASFYTRWPYIEPSDVLAYVKTVARRGDADGVLAAIDKFSAYYPMYKIGPEKGAMLEAAIKAANPKLALELGTFIGYSAIRTARNLAPDARLICIEANPNNASTARSMVELAGLGDRVTILEGLSNELIPVVARRYKRADFVFEDHCKQCYLPDLLAMEAAGIVGAGTWLMADNVIYPGAPDFMAHLKNSGLYAGAVAGAAYEYDQKWREDWVSKEDGMAMAVYLPSPDAGMPEQTEQLRKQLTDLISSGALGKSCTLLASSAPPQAA